MNGNIQKIIAFLAYRQEEQTLCKVGQARLRWWRRNGKKFRSVKAALSTWTSDEIIAWFDYADIPYRAEGRTSEACDIFWAVQDIDINDSHLPPQFKRAVNRLNKRARAWVKAKSKKNLLDKSERGLLGRAWHHSNQW